VNIGRLGALAVVTVAVFGCKRSGNAPKSEPRPLRATPEKATIPALSVGDGQGLTFAAETTRTTEPAGRRIRLLLGGGEATLTLNDPANQNAEMAFGQGTLQAVDRAHGAPLVAAVSRWLHQAEPAPGAAPCELRPFPITYVRLGADDGWEANKLFLQQGSLEAEVFLNIRSDGKQVRLVEKDDDDRLSLLALLAIAVRDGKPARRKSGPDLAGSVPLVASVSPIAGAKGVGEPQVWMGGVWIATLADGDKQKILSWSDLRKDPRRLAEIDGSISAISPSPKHDRLALVVLHPKQAGSVSSDDPGEVQVAGIDGGAPRSVAVDGPDFSIGMFSGVRWSPDGTQLIVEGLGPPKLPRDALTRVYDVASGRMLSSATAKPPPTAPVRSPGGRYTVTFRTTSVDIAGPGGRRRFQPRSEDHRAAVEALSEDPEVAPWVGGGAVVLMSGTPMALELATAKLRYVFPDDDLQFMSASGDGGIIVARDDAKRLLWGRVAK
jgi:hypothetical protein